MCIVVIEYWMLYFQLCTRLFFVAVLFFIGRIKGLEWVFTRKKRSSLRGLTPVACGCVFVGLDGLARFEVCLWVVADGAFFGRGSACMDMTAI